MANHATRFSMLLPADADAAAPEAMSCRECGQPMFLTAESTGHHAGDTFDGIDHARDRDHTAVADGEA